MKEIEPDDPPSSKYEWLDYLGKEWTHIKASNNHKYLLANGERLGMAIGFEILKSMYPNATTDQLEETQQFYLRLPDGAGGWENVLVVVDKFIFPGSKIMGLYYSEEEAANATQ